MDDTHLLKHIKQAILVWSFRQNTFLGSLLLKCSIRSCYAIAVVTAPGAAVRVAPPAPPRLQAAGTMKSLGAEITGKTGKQPRNIFCLNAKLILLV